MTLDTGACIVQIDCFLLQKQPDDTTKPIRYWSCSLTEAGKRSDPIHINCLVLVWAVFLLQPFLEGHLFTSRTNHGAPKWILNFAASTRRLVLWRLRLSEFDFQHIQRTEIEHQTADASLQLVTNSENTGALKCDIPLLEIDKHIPEDTSTNPDFVASPQSFHLSALTKFL